jgi:dihydroorotase
VTVLDPDRGQPAAGRLATGPGGLVRLTVDRAPGDTAASDATADDELFVSPGWVDLHTHVYDGVTQISVPPDRVGLDQGVHVIADAGSAGEATVRGLVDYVLPSARTTVRIWLNIGSHGLVHLHEVADPSFIDVDATVNAIETHRELVCGVKVRSSGLIVGEMGLQPLQLARVAARAVQLPLMVHIGEAPPAIEDVVDLLDAGDVITHCFHGKPGKPWMDDGTPIPALRRAIDRGVLLDVGHGAASFDAEVARAALVQGYAPDSISTDIHVRNIAGPVFSLAAVLTKLVAVGMPLADAIAAVTTNPRRVLDLTIPWRGADGALKHATVFRLSSTPPSGRTYLDSTGSALHPGRHIVPVATIVDGVQRPCAGTETHHE